MEKLLQLDWSFTSLYLFQIIPCSSCKKLAGNDILNNECFMTRFSSSCKLINEFNSTYDCRIAAFISVMCKKKQSSLPNKNETKRLISSIQETMKNLSLVHAFIYQGLDSIMSFFMKFCSFKRCSHLLSCSKQTTKATTDMHKRIPKPHENKNVSLKNLWHYGNSVINTMYQKLHLKCGLFCC